MHVKMASAEKWESFLSLSMWEELSEFAFRSNYGGVRTCLAKREKSPWEGGMGSSVTETEWHCVYARNDPSAAQCIPLLKRKSPTNHAPLDNSPSRQQLLGHVPTSSLQQLQTSRWTVRRQASDTRLA